MHLFVLVSTLKIWSAVLAGVTAFGVGGLVGA